MIIKEKKKLFCLIIFIFVLIVVLIAGTVIKFSSNENNYVSSPATKDYTIPESNPAQKTFEIINKFDLIPIAANKAIPSVVHLSMDMRSSRKLSLKLRKQELDKVYFHKSGINIYKPLQKNYQSLGSGVIVSSDGYILTNNHVIEHFARRIMVELQGNRKYKAKVIGKDPKTDLAVIKINAKNLLSIKFGDSDKSKVGDIVLAVGNPFGIGESVTMGIISAIGRSNIGIADYEDFIQTDAAINPGNSGGALINLKGELIGINTAILTKGGGYEGIGLAIPSNMALRIFKEIMAKGKVERGWVGIAIQNINHKTAEKFNFKDNKGVIIVDVVSGSPADVSGLKKGDIVLLVNKISLKNKSHLRNIVAISGIGSSIQFKILRKGNFLEIPVKVSKLPDKMNFFDVKNFSFPAR